MTTHVYVAEHAREEGVHAPGVAATGCIKRKCKTHSSDWRARPGSPENLHRAGAFHVRTSIADMAVHRYNTEAHYVGYEMSLDGVPLVRQPRLCKDALTWVRSEGYDVRLVVLSADVDTPPSSPGAKGHVPWTPAQRAEFDDLWARGAGPLATCGLYLSPKGYRLVQPLLVPLEVLAGERALRLWIERLVEAGVWENVRQVKDWARHFRTPFHRREGKSVEPAMADWSRMRPVEVEVPAASFKPRPRASHPRAASAHLESFEDSCPPAWEAVADALGGVMRDTVTADWRDCYRGLAGALLEQGCPPAALPAVIARAHAVDRSYPEWESYLPDRLGIARSTATRWCSTDSSTGERPGVQGISFLRKNFPGVAVMFDVLRASGALDGARGPVSGVRCTPATDMPPEIPVREAVAAIARELDQAFGAVVIAAPPGTGKTHAVVEKARHLPVIGQRAAPGSRLVVSAPRHDLAEQTASMLPKSLHLFSPPSLVRNGRPVCVYAEAAKALATGRQSVRREFCEGRGKEPCDAADGCDAREGIQGDATANLVVGVHGLMRELLEYAGQSGTLVVDEPGEIVLTDRVTLDDLETARRYLDAFVPRYATRIAPALAALTAWVREVGPVEGALVSMQDAVRAAVHTLADDLLEAAGVDLDHVDDAVLLTAASAIADDARTTAPPLERRTIILARANAGRAAELGRASKVLDLVWRGIVARVPFALRIDERGGERAATVVSINGDLVTALSHDRVVVLDADAGLHIAAITKVLGCAPRFVSLAVADGAPIRRTILATGGATKRSWMPRGVPDWAAIVPALRAAMAWAREDTSARKVALIAPKEMHVAIAYALRPDAPETAKLVKESRLTRRALDRARAEIAPVLATFPGELVTGHFGALEGLNHMADCDATITLSDPRPNLGDEAIKCEYLGLDLDGRLDALAAAELGQAHGRLRTIHRTRAGRQLHVGAVVPAGWRQVDVRRLPVGRPQNVAAMTAEELRDLRDRMGMSVRELARALGVSDRTIRRFEPQSGTEAPRPIPEDFARAVRSLAPGAAETPSRECLYQVVSAASGVQSLATGGFGRTALQGVSAAPPGPLRARRIDLTAVMEQDR